MNYVVFDLEWNQCPNGKGREIAGLPFEIIEIGAVKLNEDKVIVDSFHELVKPTVYKWIHARTREVIHLDYQNLLSGDIFPEAVQRFLEWCGEDFIFCTWGNQDLYELQRNLKFYNMLEKLPGPIIYYDIQKMFSLCFEDGKSRHSLEYAIDFLGVSKDLSFHRALTDAYYTGVILQKINKEEVFCYTSVDVYQNPKKRKEECHLSYPTYDKYVSKEFVSKEKAMKDREATSTRCPVCHQPAKRKIRWFSVNSRHYYSVSICPEHGMVKGKIRMKRTEDEKFYVVKTLKLIGEEDLKLIQEKQETLRVKRLQRRRQTGHKHA